MEVSRHLTIIVALFVVVGCTPSAEDFIENRPAAPAPSPAGGDDDDDNDGGEGEGEGETDCELETIDVPTQAACAAATRTCLEACADDDACYDACIVADAGGDNCGGCLEDAFLGCVNAAGCQTQFDALFCCAEGCADPDADECYTTTCATETTAYDACFEAQADACETSDDVCFQT